MCLCSFFIIFSTFSQHFFSWFSFRFNQNFQVHGVTINFSFVLFFSFFILTICLLRATMPAIDGLPSWSISSHMRIVLKGWLFGPKLFISFLSKERIMAQKCFREMGNFWSTCPRHQFSEYHDLGILCFWSLKRFGKLEAVASLDAYQITNYQFLSKTHHFIAWFRRIREEVSKSRILWPNAWVGVIKWFIWFFKIVHLETPFFFYSNDSIVKENIY